MLGAIRLARHLNLGPEDNVVTIATDGFDRYPSVLTDLAETRRPVRPRHTQCRVRRGLPRRQS